MNNDAKLEVVLEVDGEPEAILYGTADEILDHMNASIARGENVVICMPDGKRYKLVDDK